MVKQPQLKGQSESEGRPRDPYFQGQQTRHSYQPVNIPHQDSNENDCDETEDLKHCRGIDRGRGRGRGQGRGFKKRNFRQNKNSLANTRQKKRR